MKAHNEENTQRINELFHGAKGIDEKKTERKSLRLTPEQEPRQSHKAGEVQVLTRPSAVEEAEYLVKRIEPMILHIQQGKETGYTPQGLAILDAVIKRIEELKNSVEVDMREVIDLGNAGLRTAELTASAALNKKLPEIFRELGIEWEKVKAEQASRERRLLAASLQGHQRTESTAKQDTESVTKSKKKNRKKRKPKKTTGTTATTTAVGAPANEAERGRALSLASDSTIVGGVHDRPLAPVSPQSSNDPAPITGHAEPTLQSIIDDYYRKKKRGWDHRKMLAFELLNLPCPHTSGVLRLILKIIISTTLIADLASTGYSEHPASCLHPVL